LVVAPTQTSQAWKLAKEQRYAAAAADHNPRPRHSHTGMTVAAAAVAESLYASALVWLLPGLLPGLPLLSLPAPAEV